MAEEVKEKLTTQDVNEDAPVDNSAEENVEDYFNPFADIKEEEEAPVKKGSVDEEEEEAPVKRDPVVAETSNELKEVKASIEAQREVAKLVRDNPMYADYAEEIAEITAKAIVRGHKNPVEFAIRNIKSPQEWIEIGRKSGIEDAGVALKSKVGGASMGRGESTAPDFTSMDTKDFEKFVNSVKNL
jgi:hypothetical protein